MSFNTATPLPKRQLGCSRGPTRVAQRCCHSPNGAPTRDKVHPTQAEGKGKRRREGLIPVVIVTISVLVFGVVLLMLNLRRSAKTFSPQQTQWHDKTNNISRNTTKHEQSQISYWSPVKHLDQFLDSKRIKSVGNRSDFPTETCSLLIQKLKSLLQFYLKHLFEPRR